MKNIKLFLILFTFLLCCNVNAQTCDPLIAAYSFVSTDGSDNCITDETVELEIDWGMGGDFGDCTAPIGSFQIQINLPAAGPYGVFSAADVITPSSFSWSLVGTSLIGTNDVAITALEEGTIVVTIYGISTNGCLQVASNAQITILPSSLGGSPSAFADDLDNNGDDLPASIGVDQVTPVKLSRFIAGANDCGSTTLLWTTESETNNEKFIVERSIDGKTFDEVGTIAGFGDSNVYREYEFVDEYFIDASFSEVYYRLNQVDFDGGGDHSDILRVRRDCANGISGFRVTPNPATEYITIQLEKAATEAHTGVIVNNVGQSVKNLFLAYSKKIDISDFQPGVYSVKLNIDGETITKRFIVVK